jgi:hypothetical protein
MVDQIRVLDRILVPRLQKVNRIVPTLPDVPSNHLCDVQSRLHRHLDVQPE